jgi:epoxyqueuosine reductase
MSKTHSLAEQLAIRALDAGFDLMGIAPAGPLQTANRYRSWLERGYHGHMAYLARPDSVAKRADLGQVLPGVKTVIVLGANYHLGRNGLGPQDYLSRGVIASYARGDDYHEVLAPHLHELAAFAESYTGCAMGYRAYVDTGPLLERELGVRAGLGFAGKNTNLIHPRLGSWVLLGVLLLSVEVKATGLVADTSKNSNGLGGRTGWREGTCGQCTRCLDACPTGAFVAPYVLDARRCISYLTIELKGPIPRELRPLLGNRIFGCDVCQDVCPWNLRFAQPTSARALQPRQRNNAPSLLELMVLDDEGFRQRFTKSPIKRAKRRGLLRNVAVALGNWGDPVAIPVLSRALRDAEPLIRGHAAWALGQICSETARQEVRQALYSEDDLWVQEELRQALP